MPRYEFSEGSSNKFWQIDLDGASFTTTFGKIGTAGQSSSKSFDSDAKALVEYNKLIAEKTKKGYQLVGGGAAPATATAATPAPTPRVAKPKPAAPTPAAAPAAAPTPAQPAAPIVANAERSIAIEASDWSWATWRPLPPMPEMVQATEFDLDACLARLTKHVKSELSGWLWDFSRAGLAPTMSKAEARFWLECLLTVDQKHPPAKLAAQLAKQPLAPMSLRDVYVALRKLHRVPREFALVTMALFSPMEVVELLNDARPSTRGYQRGGDLMLGFRVDVVPHLLPSEVQTWRQRIGPMLTPANFPAAGKNNDLYCEAAFEFQLAAALGMHDELLAVVESWADDRYSKEEWHDAYQVPQLIIFGLGSAALVDKHMRRLKLRLREPHYMRAWLAHTEYAGLDYAAKCIVDTKNKDDAAAIAEVLALVHAPENAGPMLEVMTRSKAPKIGAAWLADNPAHALQGLAVVATGRGALAEAAANRLAELRRATGDGGDDGPRAPEMTTPPPWLQHALAAAGKLKAVPWINAAVLPDLIIGEERLNSSHVPTLVSALAASTLEAPHPLVADVRNHAQAASRDAFAWRVFEAWLTNGTPPKDKWAFLAVGQLGSDVSARKLAPLIRAWPGESQHQRAVLGLDVLGAIGSDVALMMLNGIAQKVKFKALQERAREKMDGIAAKRGMTAEQLADRLVPDLDLEDDGSKTLDFGPRSFRVGFDEALSPFVVDATGTRLKDLPKPNSKDDATLSAEAVETWKAMKKDVRALASIQITRLELAMGNARRWSGEEFRNFFVEHPLLTHLVRRLVWGVYAADGSVQQTFRVAEDRSYADQHDETISIAPDAVVGIVHRLQLADADAAAWGKVFGDYELTQPYEQLAREVFALAPAERTGTALKRFENRVVETKKILGLLSRGWRKGTAQDAGCIFEVYKNIRPGLVAVLPFEMGLNAGGMEYVDPTQKLGIIDFAADEPNWSTRSNLFDLSTIDDVTLSEVIRDVESMGTSG